ncbi:hypothetical protein LZ31DRAFT_268140 [Colletotrichum somersetense]|nr:hypothetical protein LZ31DRAFT_268140 [Colletotrichum somersetense]
MKISILTAILYSVASVNAASSCWCYIKNRKADNTITQAACNSASYRSVRVDGSIICSILNPNHQNWITTCRRAGGSSGYCTV